MTLFVGQRAREMQGRIDTVVFDMDGVLIDISRSIRQVNLLAPAFYLRELLGWQSTNEILTSDDIERYKHAGGFNDDWDLTYAIVLLYLVKAQLYGEDDADYLNVQTPSHADFAVNIAAEGGGLASAEDILLNHAQRMWRAEIDQAQVRRQYDKPTIRRVFEEMLAGDLCERMYHHPATLYRGRGLIYEDRCLLDMTNLPRGKKIGMQTGRTYEESVIGREFCGLMEILPDEVCVTKRDGLHKPEPGGLALLAERLKTRTGGVYIGDTLDDLRTVRNLNALGTVPPFLAALALTGPAGESNEALFKESGADIIGADVNEVLQWINSSSK